MSRRSRSNPWWERCDILGHDCRWCRSAERRAIHLDMLQQVVDLESMAVALDPILFEPISPIKSPTISLEDFFRAR